MKKLKEKEEKKRKNKNEGGEKMELFYIFLGIALLYLAASFLYLAASFFVSIAIYKKIRRNTKKRHWGILLGENKPKVFAIVKAINLSRGCSTKILEMKDEEVERMLDIEFAPTYLI